MKLHPILLLAALCACNALAQTAESPKRYALRTNQVDRSSGDTTALAHGAAYPLHRRYENFTPEEKAVIRSMYEGMPETDEPPFPARGMAHIVSQVSQIAGGFEQEGEVTIFVNVDAKGDATGVKVLKAPSPEVAKTIAFVLMKERYKPAVCGGAPCELEFPFRTKLSLH